MRLIDADELISNLEEIDLYKEDKVGKLGVLKSILVAEGMATATKQHTIDPELKKGKWIEPSRNGCLTFDYKAYRECSVCGEKQFLAEKMKFCPHCGSLMMRQEGEAHGRPDKAQ